MKHNTKIGIIGFGNFGTLISNILAKDFEVTIYDDAPSQEKIKRANLLSLDIKKMRDISDCDILILSAPISSTEKIIKNIAPRLKPASLILDSCSVKVLPCSWLEKHVPKNIQIMGTHPMFGPTTTAYDIDKQTWSLDGLQIVLCPLRIEEELKNNIEKYLQGQKLKVITTSPDEHDKQNAKTLSFVHFVGRSLLASGIGHQDIFTPGYSDLLSILPHTTSDNWQLFYDMNNYNPYSAELREIFRDSGLWLEKKILKNQEKDELVINREIIDLLDNRIIKLLKERFECVQDIAKIKKERNMEVIDKSREKQIINEKKEKYDLDADFIEELYSIILKQSYKQQE